MMEVISIHKDPGGHWYFALVKKRVHVYYWWVEVDRCVDELSVYNYIHNKRTYRAPYSGKLLPCGGAYTYARNQGWIK